MFEIPRKIEYVIDTLLKNGFEAYIVGGCVRDMLLGAEPHDFDVTTSATPKEVISLFEKTIPTGIKHGTVTVMVEKEPVEVTTFRTEGKYQDHRHPENVTFVKSLKEDLARRDFTVNAMAYNEKTGLCDYFGGKEDLENCLLRAVGNPEKRFSEDALRILRLYRFSATLEFKIEEETEKAALLLSDTLRNISGERIAAELKKAVLGDNLKAIAPLINKGGFSFLKLLETPDFEVIRQCKSNKKLCFFLFFYLSSSDIQRAVEELKLSNKEKEYFAKMTLLCNGKIPVSKAEIKELLRKSDKEIFQDYLFYLKAKGGKVAETEKLFGEITENAEAYLISDLKLGGKDLIKLGFSGEKIGEALEYLLSEVIKNPQINNEKDLTILLRNFN